MGLCDRADDSAHRPHAAVRELTELFRYRDLIRSWSRNVKVRYKRSVLGLAWSMLSPLMTMVALSVVFTQVFRPTAPNYPVYLFPGLLLWSFFAQTTSTIAVEVVGGVELWKRIYTPRTAFAVATVCTGLVHLALALGPLFALMLLFHTPFGVALAALPVVVLFTALFALGVGLAVAAAAGYFADVADSVSDRALGCGCTSRPSSTRGPSSGGALPVDFSHQPDGAVRRGVPDADLRTHHAAPGPAPVAAVGMATLCVRLAAVHARRR